MKYLNKLTFSHLLCTLDNKVDAVIRQCINRTDDFKVEFSKYYTTITYENGDVLICWTANKWYGWLSKWSYSTKDKTIISWNSERPRRQTMIDFDKYLNGLFLKMI